MSRWLSSVNNLLEKLDDTAETVAQDLDRGAAGIHSGVDIDDILEKRGLAVDSDDVGEEDNDEDVLVADIEAPSQEDENTADATIESDEIASGEDAKSTIENESAASESPIDTKKDQHTKSLAEVKNLEESRQESSKKTSASSEPAIKKKQSTVPAPASTPVRKPKPTPIVQGGSLTSPARQNKSEREKELTMEAKEAQKESRTLRRHVVSLNTQLEAAESELRAQRKELEGAAGQMEQDRLRAKQSKETTMKLHSRELMALQAQNEQSLKDQQARFEDQLESYRKKVADVESQRKREDGDWSKEMTNIIEREQEVNKRLMLLEDEKLTLLQQISTLEGQQAALGSRLESLTQATDNAMNREREAEDRLDSALTQHARQISHRQARESELERTIQELNTALVAKTNQRTRTNPSKRNGGEAADSSSDVSLTARVGNLQSELETANAHLALEREALHQELRDMSKESTQEASAVHAKQVRYDRRVAELELAISKLRREKTQNDTTGESQNHVSSKASDSELSSQVKVLSEELMRLRGKVSNQSSETLALKNRLQTAVNRASKAEDELAVALAEGNGKYDSMEKGGGSSGLGRRRRAAPQSGSIRAAMRLNPGQGERTEQIGKVVDVFDSFAVSTGKYLRRNPLARAGFIFYLLLMHLWTFVLLFFHAHSFESDHADFGAQGPHALMQQSLLQQMQQGAVLNKTNVDASTSAKVLP